MKMGNLYKIYSSLSLEIWELFLKYGFRSEVFDIVFCLTFSFYILWWLVIRMRPRNFNLYKICCVFFLENMQGKGYEHISKYFPSTVRLCLENISCWFAFKLFFKNVKPYEFKNNLHIICHKFCLLERWRYKLSITIMWETHRMQQIQMDFSDYLWYDLHCRIHVQSSNHIFYLWVLPGLFESYVCYMLRVFL